MAAVSEVDCGDARAAVEAAGHRVTQLVRSVRRPDAPALGTWTAAEVAAHLTHSLGAVTAMAEGGGGVIDDLWNLSRMTERLVAAESERNMAVLADRIGDTVGRFLSIVAPIAGNPSRPWLVEGVEVTVPTLVCHFLNELVVHGRDIALADGQPWPISRTDGALVVCGFLLPALGVLGPVMVDQRAAAGVRTTFDVRMRGGCRVVMRFDDGDLKVAPALAGDRIDCHISADPVAFLLVAWGRISQWQAIGRGQLLGWGRRPWMGLSLRKLLRNP